MNNNELPPNSKKDEFEKIRIKNEAYARQIPRRENKKIENETKVLSSNPEVSDKIIDWEKTTTLKSQEIRDPSFIITDAICLCMMTRSDVQISKSLGQNPILIKFSTVKYACDLQGLEIPEDGFKTDEISKEQTDPFSHSIMFLSGYYTAMMVFLNRVDWGKQQ